MIATGGGECLRCFFFVFLCFLASSSDPDALCSEREADRRVTGAGGGDAGGGDVAAGGGDAAAGCAGDGERERDADGDRERCFFFLDRFDLRGFG